MTPLQDIQHFRRPLFEVSDRRWGKDVVHVLDRLGKHDTPGVEDLSSEVAWRSVEGILVDAEEHSIVEKLLGRG